MFRNHPSFPFGAARDVQSPRQQPFRSPKVVSIPVHFVDSETASSTLMSKSTAALKIQKVWRGFLVRKNVNKISGIKREAEAIEKRISDKDTADLIRGEARERLKVNEMLMGLLLRLDSIRGVDLEVRDCRKRVIKKVIMLQEKVDGIAPRDADDEKEESQECAATEDQMPVEERPNSVALVEEEEENDRIECCGSGEEKSNSVAEEVTDGGECVQDDEGYLLVKTEDECGGDKEAMEVEHSECEAAAAGEVENQKKGLMEKMIERNEILIGLVSDLCEKNKMQTQIINSLSSRVDNLEKLFRSKSKRRKQQQLPRCETKP